MLKANVGLSHKASKNYQSTGFSVNLEGEVTASVSDPNAVIEQVKELFDLAEEALDQQIDRSRGIDAVAGRDEDTSHNRQNGSASNGSNGSQQDEPATEKQIDFLLKIGKQERLTAARLEAKVAEILGYEVGIYDLSKRQAGQVLDELTKNGRQPAGRRH